MRKTPIIESLSKPKLASSGAPAFAASEALQNEIATSSCEGLKVNGSSSE
jgi:hypothetical protein